MKNQKIFPFLFFFLSGFCGLLYQVIWLRLAFYSFGVITPVLSVVVSVFMLGLALGSWFGGKYIDPLCERSKMPPLFYYGCTELCIGIGALVVPKLFHFTESFLFRFGELNSVAYLLGSALMISINILPWCFLMGLTYVLMMAHFKQNQESAPSSFSFLYLANVIGAMVGVLSTAYIFIELIGFQKTLWLAAGVNWSIAAMSFWLAKGLSVKTVNTNIQSVEVKTPYALFAILFVTGFCSMALEVVWTRAFTAVLETTVYAFASLVATYLLATWIGSYRYRKDLNRNTIMQTPLLLGLLAVSVMFPILFNDPRIHTLKSLVLVSIIPLSAILGYLTPKLIDDLSGGNPDSAGRAYAVNILGCIIGPLVASYLLLPAMGSKMSMVVLALPFLAILWFCSAASFKFRTVPMVTALLLALFAGFISLSYEERFRDRNYQANGVTRRDHTATVISYGTDGINKHLFVNGVGITILTTVTKWMAYLPLTHLQYKPKSTLVICFGMGTTFRSMLRWPDLEHVTAVELVPSVKDAFGYYHSDAPQVMADPRGQVVVDDGRRFLRRTRQKFDVITLDPPPPIQAAGSGMLYSKEFLQLMKSHLQPGGILAHWIPGGAEPIFLNGVTAALSDTFKYVRYFSSPFGIHYLASDTETPNLTTEQIVARLPESAKSDILDWEVDKNIFTQTSRVMGQEKTLAMILGSDLSNMASIPRTTDEFPLNEYYKVREWKTKIRRIKAVMNGKKPVG